MRLTVCFTPEHPETAPRDIVNSGNALGYQRRRQDASVPGRQINSQWPYAYTCASAEPEAV
ncbi:hypothetical protein Dda_2665 [Drechslerella dactyloides]|uniref:Uncharacterized protein n=1 Tax=Drechslerella dactyloides TaxID=74499 RepID=A0AAD6NJL3_DREDA|nr:hypothetical protein Dda_2665 [Drechslerella dactyloides]